MEKEVLLQVVCTLVVNISEYIFLRLYGEVATL